MPGIKLGKMTVHASDKLPTIIKFLCRQAKRRGWNLMDLTLRLNQTWEDLYPEDE